MLIDLFTYFVCFLYHYHIRGRKCYCFLFGQTNFFLSFWFVNMSISFLASWPWGEISRFRCLGGGGQLAVYGCIYHVSIVSLVLLVVFHVLWYFHKFLTSLASLLILFSLYFILLFWHHFGGLARHAQGFFIASSLSSFTLIWLHMLCMPQ